MWQCKKCRESSEDSFEVCWNCGTSRLGVEDLEFERVDEAGPITGGEAAEFPPSEPPSVAPPPEQAIQTTAPVPPVRRTVPSRCPHCGGVDIVPAVNLGLSTEGGRVGLKHTAMLLLVGVEPMLADLCMRCGTITRLYIEDTEKKWITD